MSAEQLITEHIDLWTSTVKARKTQGRGSSKKRELYGIKKLRVLILELAVRGKLVEQDPNDEPACELLKRIAVEKAQFIKEKKIKEPKRLAVIKDREKPFALPLGWKWARLGDIGLTQTGGTPKKSDAHHYGNYMPFVKPGDIIDNSITSYNNDGLSKEGVGSLGRVASGGSVLMVCIGTIGKCALIERDCSFNQQINSVTPYVDIGGFVHVVLSALYFQKLAWENSSSTTLSILNKGKWENIPVALAPNMEQHRIVAKVDELMALCDQLEQQTESSLDAHNLLVDTLLATLTDARDANGLSDNWARLADHFDTLITTDYAVEQLKQTILQLAVMGKLVPQDPNEEPASELLKRIVAEKKQLIEDHKIKKQKPLPKITKEEKPINLPKGWEVARFGDLTSRLGSGSTPRGGKSAYVDNGIPFLRSQNIWNDGLKLNDVVYISDEVHLKMDNTKVVAGDVLLNITGASLGRSTIFPRELGEANVSQHVTIIRLINQRMSEFIHLGILSPLIQKLVWERQVGMAIEGLSKKVLEQFEFPVPPLNEQYRIVAKVEKLMLICEQLKADLQKAQTTQLYLADSIVKAEL